MGIGVKGVGLGDEIGRLSRECLNTHHPTATACLTQK